MLSHKSGARHLLSGVAHLECVHLGGARVVHTLAHVLFWMGRLCEFWLTELGKTDAIMADSWHVSGCHKHAVENASVHSQRTMGPRTTMSDESAHVQVNTARAPGDGTTPNTLDPQY